MTDEPASAGFFRSARLSNRTSEHFGKVPRVQILTVEDLLGGKTLQMPPSMTRTFNQAESVQEEAKYPPHLFA